jgi:hypothetical protein
MITTVVTARSESNNLHSAHTAQRWPRVNSLSESSELGRRLAKPFPVGGESHPANPRPIRYTIGARSRPAGVILDFARNGTSAAQNHLAPWNENHDSLTLIELIGIGGLFLATFFYPAMAWLLL